VARPRLYRTEAVVLKRTDFGEADKIITLYTPHLGKLRAVAKGVRRPTSKLGGHVELFTHSQMLLAKGRQLDIVTQSETIHSYRPLREDLTRIALACYAAEMLDKLMEDGVESYPVFELLLHTLERLATAADPELALRLYEVMLLGFVGFRPELHHCLNCRALLVPAGNFFSAVEGGVLCPQCGRSAPNARPLSTNAFKLLRLFQRGDYALVSRLRVSDALRQEVGGALKEYTQYTVERELKSSAILGSLRA